MRRTISIPLAMAAALLLAACGTAENEDGLTSAEQRELDEAAASLDEAQAEYENALQEGSSGTEEAER